MTESQCPQCKTIYPSDLVQGFWLDGSPAPVCPICYLEGLRNIYPDYQFGGEYAKELYARALEIREKGQKE